MRKILLILVIFILLGIGAWLIFKPSQTAPAHEELTNVLPFGSGEGIENSPTASGEVPGALSGPTTSSSHLFKLSNTPVSGAVAFMKAGELTVRYVERATGHIYDINPANMAKQKLVNETIPKVYEAVWKPDGSAVVFRTLRSDGETIDSTSYTLVPPSGTSTSDLYTTKANGLSANISELAGGQNTIFYTTKGLPQITTALFDGTKAATITNLGFNQWNLYPIGNASVFITTKAASGIDGYAYTLNAKSGALQKVLGPLPSLVAITNANNTRMLYSYTVNGSTVLEMKKVAGTATNISPATIAEKCVWGNKNSDALYCSIPTQRLAAGEPSLWYQGATHYTDRLWKFDFSIGTDDVLVEPKKSFNVDIDAENLFLSPNEDYLFFTNKNDLSLWALKLD